MGKIFLLATKQAELDAYTPDEPIRLPAVLRPSPLPLLGGGTTYLVVGPSGPPSISWVLKC